MRVRPGQFFAVVANEVKDLAQETSKATEDIGRRARAFELETLVGRFHV